MFSALGIILALYFASTLGHENATLSPWYEKYLGLAVEKVPELAQATDTHYKENILGCMASNGPHRL